MNTVNTLDTIKTNYLEKVKAFKEIENSFIIKMNELEDQGEALNEKVFEIMHRKGLKSNDPSWDTDPEIIECYEQIKDNLSKTKALKKEFIDNHKKPSWLDDLLQPLAKALKNETNAEEYFVGVPTKENKHHPLYRGLNWSAKILLIFEDHKSISLRLFPDNLNEGKLRYLCKESEDVYNPFNTYKAGFPSGIATKELPSTLEDIINVMW